MKHLFQIYYDTAFISWNGEGGEENVFFMYQGLAYLLPTLHLLIIHLDFRVFRGKGTKTNPRNFL